MEVANVQLTLATGSKQVTSSPALMSTPSTRSLIGGAEAVVVLFRHAVQRRPPQQGACSQSRTRLEQRSFHRLVATH